MIWKKTPSEFQEDLHVYSFILKPGSLLAHYILEDFGRLMGSLLGSLSISLPKSAPDLKNMYIKLISEKRAYQKNVQMT